MLLFSHPTGNANVRATLQALVDAGILHEFVTSVATYPNNLFGLLSRLPGCAELRRRCFAQELASRTKGAPASECVRLTAIRLGWKGLTAAENAPFSIDRIYRRIDALAALRTRRQHNRLKAVYAYEDGALNTFRVARSLGLSTCYDLPIGYWRAARRILEEEAQRQPEWATTLSALEDSKEKLARKDEELHLADAIFCASRFTAATLTEAQVPTVEPTIIPYGCPPPETAPLAPEGQGRLRVLFVGSLGQRKGLSYLLESIEMMEKACELTLIGRKPATTCAPLERALKRYRWIDSLPHDQILATMRQHDVLVFPSLFEGFGLVVTEALSQGIPVIATPHTCAPDIVTHGEDGFIVPVRDARAIAVCLDLLDRDRERLAAMKHAALSTAERRNWQSFQQNVKAAVLDHLFSLPQHAPLSASSSVLTA